MIALSIRQPWAWLIVHGYKNIENRTWKTDRRGWFYVHTGNKVDKAGYDHVRRDFPLIPLPPLAELVRGGIVGQVRLLDCVTAHSSPWFGGPYGFVLGGAHPLPFVKMPGQLGFFAVPQLEGVKA